MTERRKSDILGRDCRVHGVAIHVDLWYPNLPDSDVKAIEVGLMHVRAADSIRIEYDFDRDGYSIKQASKFHWDEHDKDHDPDWQEVAFIQAWGRETKEVIHISRPDPLPISSCGVKTISWWLWPFGPWRKDV